MIDRHRERGAALVVTLIFAAAMAAAAVAFIAGRQTDALALRGQLQGVEAQAMLEAALQQTVTVLNNRESRQRVPSQISWQFDDVTVRVQIASESGKIDLNKAEKPMLQGLAQAVGLPQAAAQAIAESVLDWRDENKAKLAHGAEGRDYRSSDRGTTGTADRPFAHPAELRYVLPVDAAAWAALAPFVTVYSGEAEPEASKAAGPVRRAMGIAQQLTDAESTKAQSDQSSSSATGDSSRSSSGQSDSLLPKSEGQSSTLSSLSSGRASGTSSGTSSTGGLSSSSSSTGGLSGSPAQGSTLSKLQSPSERHSSGSAENGSQANPGGDDITGVQTLVLDVQFPNGYEAAAKAVIVLNTDTSDGKPFTVLDWTPIARERSSGT